MSPERRLAQASYAEERVEEARAVVAKALADNEGEAWPEIANARHLEAAQGRGPRGYGAVGAFARICLWSFGLMAVIFGIFVLLRGG